MPSIDLTRAAAEPLGFDERLPLPAGTGGEEGVSPGEAEIKGSIEKGSRGFLVSGEIRGSAALRCVRCLTSFPFEYFETFELELRPVDRAPREEETRLGKNDLDVRFYDEPTLDLAELAAEQFELAMPMKPICDEACKGLCATCGTNLNEGRCDCPEEKDERWAPLAEWRPSE